MLDESLSSDGTVCNRVPKVYPEICFFPLSRNIIGGSRNKIQRGWGCDSSWYFFLPRKGWVGEDPKMATTKMNFLRKKKVFNERNGKGCNFRNSLAIRHWNMICLAIRHWNMICHTDVSP